MSGPASQLDSTKFQNSKARVWVLKHARPVKRAQQRAGLQTNTEPSENSKIPPSRRQEQLQQILQDSPQDYLSKVLDTGGVAEEISQDVTVFSCFKHIAQPAGTFSMTLVPRQNYAHELDSDDLVAVELDNGDDEQEVVNLFLIDRVQRTRKAANNFSTIERVVVTGRDLGKVPVETCVFIDSAPGFFETSLLQFLKEENLVVPSGNFGFAAVPHQVVPALIKAFASLQINGALPPSETSKYPALQSVLGGNKPLQQFVFPGDVGTNMIDTFDLSDVDHGGHVESTIGALADFVAPKDGSVTLWNLIDQFANRIVNEMFFDLREVKSSEQPSDTATKKTAKLGSQKRRYRFSLVMRQQPFDLDAWRALKTHVVQDYEVLEFEVGKSSHNVVNAFRVWMFNHGIPVLADQGWPSIYNLESVAHHGLKRYEPETQYTWPTKASAQNQDNSKGENARQSAFSAANGYLERIITWNAANEEFFEGTITMRLRPGVRIGEKIRLYTYDGDVIEFYVEAVSHNFQYPGTSTTTVTVTRGTPIQIHGSSVDAAVGRLKLGDFQNIGPTFLGFTVYGAQKTFLLSEGLPESTVPAQTSPQTSDASTPAAPTGSKTDEATKSTIKQLCEKYGEHSLTTVPQISPAILYGVCGVETTFGRGKLIAYSWQGGPLYNPPTVDTAVGIMQVKTGTAISSGGAPSATPEQLLQDNDFCMKVAATVLKNYRASLASTLGVGPTVNLLLAAYHSGIGIALRYANLVILGKPPNSGANTAPLSDSELASFNAILTTAYAARAINYASRYKAPVSS